MAYTRIITVEAKTFGGGYGVVFQFLLDMAEEKLP